MDTQYIVIDLEATCQTSNKGFTMEIIEIGAVKTDTKFNIISEFDAFIQPVLNPTLSDFCKELTTIKQDDINKAKHFNEVLGEFNYWVGDYSDKLFCSWGNYDYNQFKQDCELHSVKFPFKLDPYNLKQEVSNKLGMKRKGLRTIMKHLNLEFEGTPHRGIDDAKNTIKVCKKVFT